MTGFMQMYMIYTGAIVYPPYTPPSQPIVLNLTEDSYSAPSQPITLNLFEGA